MRYVFVLMGLILVSSAWGQAGLADIRQEFMEKCHHDSSDDSLKKRCLVLSAQLSAANMWIDLFNKYTHLCIDDNGNFLTDDNGNQLIKDGQGECVIPFNPLKYDYDPVAVPAPTFVPVEDYEMDWVTCTNAIKGENRGNCIEINLNHTSYIEFSRPLGAVTFFHSNGGDLECESSYMVRGRQCVDILFRE